MAQIRYYDIRNDEGGLAGEIEVIKYLKNLPDSYILIPWVSIPDHNKRGLEVDVLVFGPNGIFLVESKDWKGKVSGHYRMDRDWIQSNGDFKRTHTNPIPTLENKCRKLKGKIEKSFRYAMVQGILAFPDLTDIKSIDGAPSRFDSGIPPAPILAYSRISKFILDYSVQKSTNAPDELSQMASMLRPRQDISNNSQIGPYQVTHELGVYDYPFGVCRHYKAEDKAVDQIVTLKEYEFNPLNSPAKILDEQKKLKRDAIATNKLMRVGDAIPKFLTHLERSNNLYLVFEWVEGNSLRKNINHFQKRGQLPNVEWIAKFTGFMSLAASVLGQIHEENIIHRDIRPENIISPKKRSSGVVFLNFDSAKISDKPTLYQGSLAMQTAYMSPEMLADASQIDARADIYSLGASFYEFFTGVLFNRDTPLTPEIINPAIPQTLSNIIMQCLSLYPEDRPSSGKELSQLLKDAAPES